MDIVDTEYGVQNVLEIEGKKLALTLEQVEDWNENDLIFPCVECNAFHLT